VSRVRVAPSHVCRRWRSFCQEFKNLVKPPWALATIPGVGSAEGEKEVRRAKLRVTRDRFLFFRSQGSKKCRKFTVLLLLFILFELSIGMTEMGVCSRL
jgi:hypothetical protein